MSGIDDRIVTMKFDNRQFEQGAQTTLSTLQKLKQSMDFGTMAGGTVRGLNAIQDALGKIGLKTPFAPLIRGANTGMNAIGAAMERISGRNPFVRATDGAAELQRAAQAAGGPQGMGVLEGGVTAVSARFVALSTIAITALSNITNRAINASATWLKSFSFGPIMDGLHEYETNLKSIQTVQANTDRPLTEINRSLDQLNKYSDQTIYNFSEMARNVGTFTAAGVDLKTSVASIKGIANLAALSGSSSEQAAGAMYQLSQAIASGKVGLMDWNSVVNAGMGGKKLQNALAQTAVAMGKIDAAQVKGVKSGEQLKIAGQSFRESIMAQPGRESWLTSGILVNTLATMDGRFSRAALAAEKTADGLQRYSEAEITARIATARSNLEKKNNVDFTNKQFVALQKMSTMAFKSATEVKTLGQVFDIVKETIGSGWSASFRNIFGDLKQAKDLFTDMKDGLTGIIEQNALARNELLSAWSNSKMGGRSTLIDGLKNAWQALLGILGPIKDGFRDIFPEKTVEDLTGATIAFEQFTKKLIPGKDTMEDLRDISGGVFAVFSIIKTIIGGVITGVKTLFDAVGGGGGSFLEIVANIGQVIQKFDAFLKKSGIVEAFFSDLGNILALPITILQGAASLISKLFDGFNAGRASVVGDSIEKVSSGLGELREIAGDIRGFFTGLGDVVSGIGEFIGRTLSGIGRAFAAFLTSEQFDPALDAINTGLFAALTAAIVNFLRNGMTFDMGGGFFGNISEVLTEVTGSLTALQTNLNAGALLKIGGAIAVLAGALFILSTIDPLDMRRALVAMSTGFGILITALVALLKYAGPAGILQIYAVSSALAKMAISILFFSLAIKTLAGIKFGDLLRGLAGLAIMMVILQKALIPLAANHKGMIKAAASLILVGIAINLMALALKVFATMSWDEMIKGLAGLMGVLIALSVGLKRMPALETEAAALLALGVAINLIAIALKVFATMSWTEMTKGILTLTGSLLAISLALRTMPKGILLKAVALNAVASAMIILSGALKIMGSMKWSSVVKGLVVLGGAMLILAVGLNAMGPKALIGAAALTVAAVALNLLLPVLLSLAALSTGTIIKVLLALAAGFVILGVGISALAPLTPVIVALSAAMLLFGAGLALAGAGILAMTSGFAVLVSVGVAGVAVIRSILAQLIAAIPPALAAFGKGIVAFAVVIGQGAPKIVRAFGLILSNLIDLVIRMTPKLGRMFTVMLNTALRVVVAAIPKIVNAGLKLIISFLAAINKHIPKIVDLAASIIVKFINGIARNLSKIIQAGVNLIIRFIEGLSRAIRNNSERVGRAGADLGMAMVEGVVRGLVAAGDQITRKLLELAKKAWQAAKDFFSVNSPSRLMRDTIGRPIAEGVAVGIDDASDMPVRSIEDMGKSTVRALSRTMAQVEDAFYLDPNLNPTITPVLDLTKMTQEANRMSSILAVAPIAPTVSYQAAADISSITQASDEAGGPSDGRGGDTYLTYEQHLHSPQALDSVKIYRDGKSLLSLKKEELVGS